MNKKLEILIIADTESKQAKGLMFTDPLQGDQCALFIFDKPKRCCFWNKNVSYPIDLGFFDEDGVLLDIKNLEAEQEKSIKPESNKIKFVVEVKRNWFKENDIKAGKNIWDLIDLRKLR